MTARTNNNCAGTPKAEARDAGRYRPTGCLVDFDPWGAILAAMGDEPDRGMGVIDQPHAATRWQTCSRSRLPVPPDALAELTRLQVLLKGARWRGKDPGGIEARTRTAEVR